MFDKLFVRVRSWLHSDPATLPGGHAAPNGKPAHTPPPLPPDAWAESESGMVITESGIIVIDPRAAEAAGLVTPGPTRPAPPLPADRAWALPSLPTRSTGSPTPPNGTSTKAAAPPSPPPAAASKPQDLDWDEVLKRAREQINVVTPPPNGRTRNGSK